MPVLSKRLTDSVARSVPLPVSSYAIHWCPKTPGFGLRVSATGDRAYIAERRVDGKTVRRTLGKAAGAGAISSDAARELQITISSELQTGVDRAELRKEKRKADKEEAFTLAEAVSEYVKGKRRGKDGKGLKDRTKADYLGMVAAGGQRLDGEPFADGPLHAIADKSIHKITAADMRNVYEASLKKSQRRATYAMQVLRAVLNWHGIAIEDSPLDKTTAGKDKIVLAKTSGKPRPIPPEHLGAWWKAATAKAGNASADGCRVVLLTGCRPGEIFGSAYQPGLLVRDVDLAGGRMVLNDTKNRTDHTVVLALQVIDILKNHVAGKKLTEKVFPVLDPGKTLDTINAEAGTKGITPHKLRHTFASVAEELVSVYALKRMVNHADGDDTTGSHYVGKSEAQLRAAWQTVADFITDSTT